ncbi:exodeoxyribonuclease V subunit alpha [Rathayibacter sp. AY1A1]|uniref:exodeoxyribonuclease V subunit alpha n=1 Tax=Rathayibacter sp. AY1A1 TaxID=2080519 RepID=UPI000CE8A169|nr:exodeoxyribonuclease V subunit alpha [Rathayibacter sp. AY1A1]PPF50139.1 exodeoxyribonuclease V subunit alpha [Rathayibacter sp. AY1A1]PPH01429.1 exodeoxyribonuclease V subunit alpha [Rathayibacter sp. AY1G9]
MTSPPSAADIAQRATGVLAAFNQHGILTPADVHVAFRLATLLHETDESVTLALALAVRATRHGSVVIDLSSIAQTTSASEDAETSDSPGIPWPEPGAWAAACQASALTSGTEAPLRQRGTLLWLAKHDAQEQRVADQLLARTRTLPDDIDLAQLRAGLDRLFPDPADADQRLAAAICALPRVSVLAGGPGTGKTTTVSRLLALLREQRPQWRIALAAPTGKAAARLGEAVARSLETFPDADRARLSGIESTTVHRLLGWRSGPSSGFRHDHTNRLPFDIVVIDEASMVSLTMMDRLLDALRPAARLILVGDPDQLASVEAGAVLADIVGDTAPGPPTTPFLATLDAVNPNHGSAPAGPTPAHRLRDGIAQLTTNHRFHASSAISALASAIRAGHTDDTLNILRAGEAGVEFVELDDTTPPSGEVLGIVQAEIEAWSATLRAETMRGDHHAALQALESYRLLCAHRRGPRGVQHWGALAKRWATSDASGSRSPSLNAHHPGEPLIVTANDYEIGLFNGDTGIVAAPPDSRSAVTQARFDHGGQPVTVPLVRLGAVQPAYAMTVHRTQGSQFGRVTVILPTATSNLATRETLYTAVTRAVGHVRVVGSTAAIIAAVTRPILRATGLQGRLKTAVSSAAPHQGDD